MLDFVNVLRSSEEPLCPPQVLMHIKELKKVAEGEKSPPLPFQLGAEMLQTDVT